MEDYAKHLMMIEKLEKKEVVWSIVLSINNQYGKDQRDSVEIKVTMNEKKPETPTKVWSVIISRLLSKICARFLGSCHILDEADQEKQEVYMKLRRVKKVLRS